MNFNNRSDYLQGILNALNGLYYYLNDFNSTGILYYEVGDLYNVKIGENTYQCLMLNDEINVTTGIEEIIHTDMPEKSETDYSKADKTDMRINKTYLIVDKQNQKIESVEKNVTKQNDKISKITQTVDELSSQISDIADITTYGESDRAEVELTDVNESEPIMIKVHPTSTNISYLYPSDNLYPSDTQYMPNRIIRFTRTYEEEGQTLTENIDYLLPDDLLRYSDTVYDEFYLNYDSQTCQVIKRCAYNADGTVRALGTEITTDYPYPTIALGEGNYTITLPGYDFGYIYARLMAKNIYTTQFYTKVETDSRINQKADEINLGVNQTLTNYSTTNQMNSAITLKANEINAEVREKVGKTEVGTYIEQNTESVKLAWNQISEYIQMMIINNNASFAILDSSKKPIAYFDKTGIHFSSNNTAFGEMGVQTVDGNKFISFSVDGTYGSSISNGMAWGIKTTTDNKFHPIFYIKNFEMGPLNSDASYGELVLSASNLVLDGIGTGLVTGGVKIFGDPTAGGMYFYDINSNKYLMQIFPQDGLGYGEIQILDNINFFRNISNSNSFRIGTGSKYCLFTDKGYIRGNELYIVGDGTFTGYLDVTKNINCDGNVYAKNISSDKRLKKNISKAKDNATDVINKINVHSFDWKNDDIHTNYGFIAQELEEIDNNYILKQEIKNNKKEVVDYRYYVNELPILATLTKAVQELQEEIEQMKKEIKELKGGK